MMILEPFVFVCICMSKNAEAQTTVQYKLSAPLQLCMNGMNDELPLLVSCTTHAMPPFVSHSDEKRGTSMVTNTLDLFVALTYPFAHHASVFFSRSSLPPCSIGIT